MTKAVTSMDYAAILERIPPEFKKETYERMLKGSTDEQGRKVPGLSQQFMEAFVEARSFRDMVTSREEIRSKMDETDGAWEQVTKDLGQMHYLLAVKEERLDVIAKELQRIQESLESIQKAG